MKFAKSPPNGVCGAETMFTIDAGDLELKLEIVPAASLLQHEEIIPELVRRLTLEFANWSKLRNSIIIDYNHIVLDGNHRAFVFKEMELKYIPVCRIDYFHEKNELRYWFRLLDSVESLEVLKGIVEDLRREFRRVADKDALRNAMQHDFLCYGIQRSSFYASIKFPPDLVHDALRAYFIVEGGQEAIKGGHHR